jgi:hypothetical protein
MGRAGKERQRIQQKHEGQQRGDVVAQGLGRIKPSPTMKPGRCGALEKQQATRSLCARAAKPLSRRSAFDAFGVANEAD